MSRPSPSDTADAASAHLPILRVSNVGRAFESAAGTTHAVADVSFEEPAGGLVCLVGPSGCGKTTLLNAIAGFESVTSGSIEVGGELVKGPGPDRAVVFQDYALLPWSNVLRNVELGPRLLGHSKADARATALRYLDLVGLREEISKHPHHLSGGMQGRVGIARALALEPLMLLMDEPFGALDEFTRMDLQDELVRIWQKTNSTILFVTHSIDEAVYLASTILVMGGRNPGRLVTSIKVDIERPRRRTGSEFNAIKASVLRALRGEGGE